MVAKWLSRAGTILWRRREMSRTVRGRLEGTAGTQSCSAHVSIRLRASPRGRAAALLAIVPLAACAAGPPVDPIAAIERDRQPADTFIVYGHGEVGDAPSAAQITHVLENSGCESGVAIRERRVVREAPEMMVAYYGHCL
jgi:hypothetical protein